MHMFVPFVLMSSKLTKMSSSTVNADMFFTGHALICGNSKVVSEIVFVRSVDISHQTREMDLKIWLE